MTDENKGESETENEEDKTAELIEEAADPDSEEAPAEEEEKSEAGAD